MSAVEAREAYRACSRITRRRAANFFYGIRLLPPDKRRAMCAIYALARRIDDIGDGTLAPERKLAELEGVRAALRAVDADSPDPVIAALADARRRFAIPLDAFVDLVDGVEMDVAGHTYARFDELVLYCQRVAGSIGRLSLGVFGSGDPEGATPRADDLGVAMQLTNILRDVREDAAEGRTYLPAEDLRRFGCQDGLAAAPPAAAADLVRFEASRARRWFSGGLELVPLLDGRSAACVLAMTGIYRRVLSRIEDEPLAVLQRRVSLPAWEKAAVAARGLAGARAR